MVPDNPPHDDIAWARQRLGRELRLDRAHDARSDSRRRGCQQVSKPGSASASAGRAALGSGEDLRRLGGH